MSTIMKNDWPPRDKINFYAFNSITIVTGTYQKDTTTWKPPSNDQV